MLLYKYKNRKMGGTGMSKIGVLLWRKLFESGDAKRLATQIQDLSDLDIQRDIAYLPDGDQGHLLDIYRSKTSDMDAPLVINIHGGGLFASYKEVNVNFNYEWARMGYTVVSISYRRIPETTLWHQIDDVMHALRFIRENADTYGLNLDQCYLTGDSAGALLTLFAASINGSKKLQREFKIQGSALNIRALGLVSIMLDTQRKDLLRSINDMITCKADKGKAYEKYLRDPASLLDVTNPLPSILVTSTEDLIQKDTLKLESVLIRKRAPYELLNYPKGDTNKLVHVFSVCYPMYPESREVLSKIDQYFKKT